MSVRENLHNYYEKLVAEVLEEQFAAEEADLDYLCDIACVALNHLPPRYFRHEIDMAFYLSPAEFEEMREKVEGAIIEARAYVDQSLRDAAAAELAREEELRRSAEAAARARAAKGAGPDEEQAAPVSIFEAQALPPILRGKQ
ncbi:late competence development ComFB family protein [Motiliproteus sp. SC1-56]|uniref:late competence development ComFB family protein n=1 Tax=Motiliproteus sp. SC1-56 TaxID=2799565 RepID=UPI001A8CA616|nr:late competence development ComFB family protein [Motiliproteus sp. SC1-56]